MQSNDTPSIRLAQAAASGEPVRFALDDSFFSRLDQSEITGGKIAVCIAVSERTPLIYRAEVQVEGEVTVACDRCLGPLTLPVETCDSVIVKDGPAEESDADDTLYVDDRSGVYDFSWLIYELTETALPLQRVHDEGECDESVTQYILTSPDEDDEADGLIDD